MLTLHKFPEHGRCGNRLFQYASLLGIANRFEHKICVPAFPEKDCFLIGLPDQIINAEVVKEKEFHYAPEDLDMLWQKKDFALFGYWQSKKYWQHCEEYVKNHFEFKPEFIDKIMAGTEEFFTRPTIAIHIRRGDYVNNPHYYQLPITWFIRALLSINGWQDHNIIIFSDDIPYCRVHFECLPNVFFSEGRTPIEDICLMSFCDNHIISNSTFSWWGAYLSGQKNVIHSGTLFLGADLGKNISDFYPAEWKCLPAEGKINLSEVTFTIPVFYDNRDRKQNLDLAVCMLQMSFDTNIIIGEQGGNKFEYMDKWCRYINFSEMKNFHRTKMLNDMAMVAETPYVANWDADVIIPPMQVYLTVLKLRGGVDMVFPYDGRFSRWPRDPWFKRIEENLDIGITAGVLPKGSRGKDITGETSVGGAVFFNKESFIDGGMENEYMISFGPEDCERNDRFKMLGFSVERIGGCLYHIDHWVGVDSTPYNPYFKDNHVEIEKIRAMNQSTLKEYVDTWSWRHKYTDAYFHRISEGAVRSAKEVFKELFSLMEIRTVIDVGCGVGEWCQEGIVYMGIDYNIPRRSLMIKPEHYINCDLEKDVVSRTGFDLCLCLEVAEHISEGRADVLIAMLCSLSNTVLFSAAIPYQGGTGHVNEQWQTYWEAKFLKNGFYASVNQPDIRKNEKIELWYRQNMVLYKKRINGSPFSFVEDFVLPEYYEQIVINLRNQIFNI